MLTTLFCYPFLYLQDGDSAIKEWFNKVAVYVILYGIIMEFVQKYLVYGRSFDLADIAFDAFGTLAGLIVMRKLYVKKIGPNRNRGRNQN
ncbi:MAG: hypothetical protein JWQ09_1689 [Segetibacter sp.]|nr:hypothetical protein [Segetibacter sp.]